MARFHDRERHCSYDTFHGGNHTADDLKNYESNRLSEFTGRRNPHDVFIKSEGGLSDLKPCFARLARALFHEFGVAVCLVVDLDKRDHDRWDGLGGVERYRDLVAELDERVRGIYSGDCGIGHERFHRKRQTMLAAEASFTHSRYAPATFDVLAFRASLEDAAGITDDESDDDEVEKLDRFVDENTRLFDRVL